VEIKNQIDFPHDQMIIAGIAKHEYRITERIDAISHNDNP
jgi:hypothetical protein